METAFKREFAFQEAEKNSLLKQLRKMSATAEKKVAAAKAQIDRIQGQALDLAVESDRMQQRIADAERQVETMEEGSSILESTLNQVASRLEKGDVKLPEIKEADEKAQVAQLGLAFEKSIELLGQYTKVRKDQGSFFAPDGTKLQGSIVRLGNIASYGVAGDTAGPLAPAGEGRLKIWNVENGATMAKSIVSGDMPADLGMFLYESLDKPVKEEKSKTIAETAEAGGVIAWVLVGLGIFALLLAAFRVVTMLRCSGNMDAMVDRVSPLVEAGDFETAKSKLGSGSNSPSRVLRVTLDNIKRPRAQLDDAISEAVMREESRIDRFGSVIIVAAAVAPLLGLLGTVTGMISTFDVITEFGTGNPKLLSGGISEALITTQFGLVVAIPALVAGNLINGWAERLKDDLEKGALRVANVSVGIKCREAGAWKPGQGRTDEVSRLCRCGDRLRARCFLFTVVFPGLSFRHLRGAHEL